MRDYREFPTCQGDWRKMEPFLYRQMTILEEKHWWFLGRRTILDKIIRGLHLPQQAQILDSGCGTGGNLVMLRQHGQVFAMEPNEEARAMANSKNVALVRAGRLPEEIPFDSDRFDLITLLDVLEHLEDNVGTLKALSEFLTPSGSVLITVPANQFLWSQHDVVNQHKRRYSLPELRKRVGKAGLNVLFSSYFNMFLLPIIAGVRIYGRLSNRQGDGSDLKLPPAILNSFLNILFSSERFLIGRWALPFGVSAVVIANKK